MKRVLQVGLPVIALLIGGPQFAKAQETEELPSPKEVLANYVKQTGGLEKYKSVKSMKTKGKLKIPLQGINGTIEVTAVMPDKSAAVVELEGVGKVETGSNGKYTWENSAIMGPRLVTGEEAAMSKEQSDMKRIYEPESFYKSMKTVAIEDVKGTRCYKLELTTKSGSKIEAYYGVDSGLEVKSSRTVPTPLGNLRVHSYSSDYKETDGIKSPSKIQQEMDGGMVFQEIELSEITYNVEVPESAFTPPEPIQKLIDKQAAK